MARNPFTTSREGGLSTTSEGDQHRKISGKSPSRKPLDVMRQAVENRDHRKGMEEGIRSISSIYDEDLKRMEDKYKDERKQLDTTQHGEKMGHVHLGYRNIVGHERDHLDKIHEMERDLLSKTQRLEKSNLTRGLVFQREQLSVLLKEKPEDRESLRGTHERELVILKEYLALQKDRFRVNGNTQIDDYRNKLHLDERHDVERQQNPQPYGMDRKHEQENGQLSEIQDFHKEQYEHMKQLEEDQLDTWQSERPENRESLRIVHTNEHLDTTENYNLRRRQLRERHDMQTNHLMAQLVMEERHLQSPNALLDTHERTMLTTIQEEAYNNLLTQQQQRLTREEINRNYSDVTPQGTE